MLILFEFQFWHESPLTVSLSSIFQIRIETDPADRTQLRMTVASGDPTLTFELKEFIKEQLVSIPTAPPPPAPAPPAAPVAQPTNPAALTDPGALLAGLL
uniref:Clathrin adaptor alpha-adaptin appendage C-terminal subdomain domain-containing protein n=1 Tax=Populus davidiana TaxID=266767 RepID=A0A6M2EUE3_9ROSI